MTTNELKPDAPASPERSEKRTSAVCLKRDLAAQVARVAFAGAGGEPAQLSHHALAQIIETALGMHEDLRNEAAFKLQDSADCVESVLRVEIVSDTKEKVQAFRRELINLILDAPAASHADVLVMVHDGSTSDSCGNEEPRASTGRVR